MSDRCDDSFSNRALLEKAHDEDMQTEDERQLLTEYQCMLGRVAQEESKLCDIRLKFRDITENRPYAYSPYKILKSSEAEIIKELDAWDKELLKLEQTDVLKNVVAREKKKAYARAEQEGRAALARYRESATKEQEEFMRQYQISKQETLKKHEELEKRKYSKSESFGKIVSAILCISILIAMMFSVYRLSTKLHENFIEEHTYIVDTYVCYVTDTGSKYHARYCQYLYNSLNRTTVYQARRIGYGACSKCTPTIETRIEIYDTNGDSPPMETEDAVVMTGTILVFALLCLHVYLSERLAKLYLRLSE